MREAKSSANDSGLGVADGTVDGFVSRWQRSAAAERANYQAFLIELCDILGVPHPDPAGPDDAVNAYVFERMVTFHHGDGTTSTGRIDLYKRACFVLEAKQGSDQKSAADLPLFGGDAEMWTRRRRGTAIRGTKGWDDAMVRARGQAEAYAKALPVQEGWPPFLIVVDVGHVFELFADFSRTGKHYTQFPDASSFRIPLDALRHNETREMLRAVWTEPQSLDPARRAARVTREIADRLAVLAKSLEAAGHAPQTVAMFLMRCLFTMFAEDVGLLPRRSFSELLESLRGDCNKFRPMVQALWHVMNAGGFSPILRDDLLRFNGGLFENSEALTLTEAQLALLIAAAKADWRDVEPAIFGTLLERALDPRERHRLGAHYTPRTYVERLVMPTIIEPLREEWENVKTAAVALANAGQTDKAIAEVEGWHQRLCAIRVLDPACGSGNFLYVTLEHMKRLEGEILDLLRGLGDRQYTEYVQETDRHAVDPHQFLGIEKNPRAAAIADLVLWIGYLQWHFRTRGRTMPAQPVLKNFKNIECRDAILAWNRIELVCDKDGKPVTRRWDRRTMKKHPVTGKDVPDEAARVELEKYINPHPAAWPDAHFIVGNPPYIGGKDIRAELGDGYAEGLWAAYSEVPQSADLVMYWWHKAATLVRTGKSRRFGFITTNSASQMFSRRVVEAHLTAKDPLSIVFAIPDHPWVDSADGADVRVAMTVGTAGESPGMLSCVRSERPGDGEGREVSLESRPGTICADLRTGANVTSTDPLHATEGLCCPGVKLHGSGFIVTPEQAKQLGLGRVAGLEKHVRPYLNGRDLLHVPRGVMVIDLFGLTADETRQRFPEVYQWLYDRVKPERSQNNRASYRDNWWVFGEPRKEFRPALAGLSRYVTTVETAKHRTFIFLNAAVLPDNMLVNIALDDAFFLGVLSSRVHVTWALAAGGTLEDRPRYNKTRCFDPFPFPVCSEERRLRIRELGEQLDRHRKERQTLHPDLTITGMCNVLQKLKTGEALTDKEREIHEKGLVSVLKQIHEDIDREVSAAYGWPVTLADEEILGRPVSLNHERAQEENRGVIRWLRPEFQAPAAAKPTQAEMTMPEPEAVATASGKRPWPNTLPEQVQAVRSALAVRTGAVEPAEVASAFNPARADQVQMLLETLAALGHARKTPEGRFVQVLLAA